MTEVSEEAVLLKSSLEPQANFNDSLNPQRTSLASQYVNNLSRVQKKVEKPQEGIMQKIGKFFQPLGQMIKRSVSPVVQVNSNRFPARNIRQPQGRDSVLTNSSLNQSMRSKISFGSKDIDRTRFATSKSSLGSGAGQKFAIKSSAAQIQVRTPSNNSTSNKFAFGRAL